MLARQLPPTHRQENPITVIDSPTALDVPCTYCRQPAGQPCQPRDRWGTGPAAPRTQPHAVRVALAASGWAPRAHDGIPVAEPLRVLNARTVEVRCPLCAATHSHGWAEYMRTDYSGRAAHCGRSGSYVIAPTGDLA